MISRPYDPDRDQKAVHRIWRETDWIDRDDDDDTKYLDIFLSNSKALVAEINGTAECLVNSCPGTIRHQHNDISSVIVAAVTTSLIARKQGFASRLTAEIIAEAAETGLETAALGMFEQGYYSRLGFGTGPYEHMIQFDPAQLDLSIKPGIPERLGIDNYRDVHSALMKRWRGHGGVLVNPPEHVHAELGWTENPFGFGYRNSAGELTHFVWGEAKDEYGPYNITALAYRSREQLLELLALLKSLGDQVLSVRLTEPCHIQLQDLLSKPFRGQNTTKGGKYAESIIAEAYWQIRMNDIAACLAKTHLSDKPTLSFNLSLSDPIEAYLPAEQSWRGVGGDYVIHLGEQCAAEPGQKKTLPILSASVGGFSRLWLGCASANVIATSGEISGAQELLDQLDHSLSLPLPKTGWNF